MSSHPKPAPATPLNPRRRGIIVGASDGLVASLARRLVREGFSLALVARRKDKLESLCNELNQAANGSRALAYGHDVTEYQKTPDLLRKIVADLGGLDVLVFVAGVNYPPGGMDKYNFENDRLMVETNLIGAMAWLTIPALFGPLVGPPVGGFITTFISWHWIFLINVPVGLAGIWIAGRVLPDIEAERPGRIDVKGFFLAAIAASVSREPQESSERAERPLDPPATETEETPSVSPGPARSTVELTFRAERDKSRTLQSGQPATVFVEVAEAGLVEIPDLGLSAPAEPLTPARQRASGVS